MTTKEYLYRYIVADHEIDAMLVQISALEKKMVLISSPSMAERVQTSGSGDTTASIVAKLVDMQREADAKIDALKDIQREVERAILSVRNAEQREVLRRRYICGETWDIIADKMHFSRRHVLRLHGYALQNVIIPPSVP